MLLDVDGYIETAKQGYDVSVADKRKIDQVVSELDKYHVVVGALQETKWFGCEVYKVGESMVLTAGQEVPTEGVVREVRVLQCIIMLSGEAASVWKAGGG